MSYDFQENSEDEAFKRLIIKDSKKTHSRLFGGLALYSFLATLLMTAVSYILFFISPELYDRMFGTTLGIYILNAVIMYLICMPVFCFLIRKMDTRRLHKRSIGFKEFVGILAISELLMTAGNYIGIFLNGRIGSIIGREVTNTTAEMIGRSSLLSMFIFSVILAPIFEEILMRKLLIDRLSKYGSGYALIISSVAFGLFHGNFYQFFYATFLGFMLGYLYIRGGLKYSILLHMIINFMGSVMAVLFQQATTAFLGAATPEQAPLSAALIIILYAVLIYGLLIYGLILIIAKLIRRELSFRKMRDARLHIPKGALLSSAFGNVGMILFIVVSALSLLRSIFN